MTDKAYIVANKEQELDVLNKFEEKGLVWSDGENPTEWVPSKRIFEQYNFSFPYVLVDDGGMYWLRIGSIVNEEIVYDGRKEEKMYKVTQGFMNKLIEWRDNSNLDAQTSRPYAFVDGLSISEFPKVVENWWVDLDDPIDNNNRLIAIIQWLNGEDVFEVEEPHKFIVRSDVTDEDGEYWYVSMHRDMSTMWYRFENATRFNTLEEAQEWANSHQVVVEIDAEGNEVE